MDEHKQFINNLISSEKTRKAYIEAKLNILIPAQINALSKIYEIEHSKSLNGGHVLESADYLTVEELVEFAAKFRVALKIEFVSFSDMLKWENEFDPLMAEVRLLDDDEEFCEGGN